MAFMAVNFGWKAVLGIAISNGLYFLLFRKEFRALQYKFALRLIEDEIQRKYLRRRELDSEFAKAVAVVEDEVGIKRVFEAHFDKVIPRIKKRLEAQLSKKHMSSIIKEGVDRKLVQDAFDRRFEEIKLSRLREFLPGLLSEQQRVAYRDPDWDKRDDPVPAWVTIVHLGFMAWTIVNAHYPSLFIPGLLFFLGFAQVTAPFQNRIDLKPALLVGFFLGGLVIHGGVQGWWIAPVLGNLSEI
ncbi:MAG: hypothetical protein JRH12_26465, partial [Deltaproteobacteria bacterium]|nr:hypothetical protein [Deltaproteobacteria bacterium]